MYFIYLRLFLLDMFLNLLHTYCKTMEWRNTNFMKASTHKNLANTISRYKQKVERHQIVQKSACKVDLYEYKINNNTV